MKNKIVAQKQTIPPPEPPGQKALEPKCDTCVTFETASGKTINLQVLRDSVRFALKVEAEAASIFIATGQLLNETQEALEHGEFGPFIEKFVPEISYRTAARWARAAANVTKILPPPAIDIPASVILSTPDAELPPQALRWKQEFFAFTADKSINQCLRDVCVEDDEDHRVDRVINGKLKGGTTGEDRKDFPKFTGMHSLALSNFFYSFDKLTPLAQSEMEQIIIGLVLGRDVSLTRGKRTRIFDFGGTDRRRAMMPRRICEALFYALKERLKLERLNEP